MEIDNSVPKKEYEELLHNNTLLHEKQVKLLGDFTALSQASGHLCRSIQKSERFDKLDHKKVIDTIIEIVKLPTYLYLDQGLGYFWQDDALKNAQGCNIIWSEKHNVWIVTPTDQPKEIGNGKE